MSQNILPSADITVTNWAITGAATAWQALSDNSDSTYTSWAFGGNTLEVKMSTPAATPAAGAGSITFRTNFAATCNYNIYQGATLKDSGQAAKADIGITDNVVTVDASVMATITDWTDVRIRLTGSGVGGGDVYKITFTIPDGATARNSNMLSMGVG